MLLNQLLTERKLTQEDQRLLSVLQSALIAVTDETQRPAIIDRAIARLSSIKKSKALNKKRR